MSATFANELWVYGTEKEFMSAVINYITGLDSKITCSSDPDVEYDSSDLTHVPTFNFSIDGKVSFTLERPAALNIAAYTYNVTCGSYSSSPAFKHGGVVAYNAVDYRGFPISHIVNDNFVFISIGGFAWNSGYSNLNINIIYAKSGNKNYLSVFTGVDPLRKDILFNIGQRSFSEMNSDVSATFLSRFAYKAMPGKIDYIKSSVYANNGSKKFDIASIYDSSTVTVGDTISLKDGPYIAVGSHQLVKV